MLMFGVLFPRTLDTSIFPKPSINKPSAFASINIKQKNLPHPNFISGWPKKHPSVVCPSLIMEIEVSPILIVEMFSCAGVGEVKMIQMYVLKKRHNTLTQNRIRQPSTATPQHPRQCKCNLRHQLKKDHLAGIILLNSKTTCGRVTLLYSSPKQYDTHASASYQVQLSARKLLTIGQIMPNNTLQRTNLQLYRLGWNMDSPPGGYRYHAIMPTTAFATKISEKEKETSRKSSLQVIFDLR